MGAALNHDTKDGEGPVEEFKLIDHALNIVRVDVEDDEHLQHAAHGEKEKCLVLFNFVWTLFDKPDFVAFCLILFKMHDFFQKLTCRYFASTVST